jgi:predicted ATPase
MRGRNGRGSAPSSGPVVLRGRVPPVGECLGRLSVGRGRSRGRHGGSLRAIVPIRRAGRAPASPLVVELEPAVFLGAACSARAYGVNQGERVMFPRHLERVDWAPHPRRPPDLTTWPFTIPAVAQLIREGGLEIPPGITFLVGENGSGKSTLVEAMAELYPRPGHPPAISGPAASEEDSPLLWHLQPRLHRFASPAGFFLRAEAMHAFLSAADADSTQARAWGGEPLGEQSHGESFLAVLRHRFDEQGVYFLDEPEAALSFQSCLGLIALLDMMRREGSQVVVATHSPLLVTLPGANLIELDETGFRAVSSFEQLNLVQQWRAFLAEPKRYLRHLLDQHDPSVDDES